MKQSKKIKLAIEIVVNLLISFICKCLTQPNKSDLYFIIIAHFSQIFAALFSYFYCTRAH